MGRTSSLSWFAIVLLAACEKDAPPTDPASLVIVVQADELFWGNDQHRQPHDCRAPDEIASGAPCRIVKTNRGVVTDLGAAVPAIVDAAPRGTEVAVLAYSDQVDVKYQGPIAGLTTESLGAQVAQVNRNGKDLSAGLAAALDRLERAPREGRTLIIVTDGWAARHEDLAPIAARIGSAKVDVTSFTLDLTGIIIDPVDPPRSELATLGRVIALREAVDLRTALPAAVAR